MKEFTIGTAITVEADIKRHTPHGDDAYADPDNGCDITIRDEKNVIKVDGQSMTKSATGKYYYIWQTATADAPGIYRAHITADGASYDGVLQQSVMKLVENKTR